MDRIKKLESLVDDLYQRRDPNRDEWADWLYKNHVKVVADYADQLSDRFNADQQVSRAGALLHDIADAKISRFDANHELLSLEIAESLLRKSGYDENAIQLLVRDALPLHSCHDGNSPKSLEGKILATADALAHIKRTFMATSPNYYRQGCRRRRCID